MAKNDKKILVVDDEPDIRDTIRVLLVSEGYDVMTAVDGDDCMQKVPHYRPHLILLDVMMPGMPAKEVVKRVNGTKVAFVTVIRTSEAEKEQLFEGKNVVGFIKKPFDIQEFLNMVKIILKD